MVGIAANSMRLLVCFKIRKYIDHQKSTETELPKKPKKTGQFKFRAVFAVFLLTHTIAMLTASKVLSERARGRGEYSFWGCAVQPQATPSQTCLPHQLCITKAALDPVTAGTLQPGTRVSVWVTQKMRSQGELNPVDAKKSLVAILSAANRESADVCLNFPRSSPPTLLSFSVSPHSHSCGVHLAGYFDHSKDESPEEADDGSITWAELKALLENARGQSGGGGGVGGGAILEQMQRQLAQTQAADADDGGCGGAVPAERKQPTAADAGKGKRAGKRKAEGEAADRGLNAKKQAALDRVMAAAAETEAKFTAPPPASAISRHAKGRTRKLAGGVSRKRDGGTHALL